MAVIKTWIQAPPDSTPIEFEEVWHLDGSTRKDNAKARFLQVKEHLLKYGLAKENEFTEILGNPSAQGGRPTTTWKMPLNVFKHYISSSQKERGCRTRGKLHQAEEEFEQLAAPETKKPEEAKPKTTNDEISVFMFPVTNQPVRIVDQSGGLWFVRNDVCDALGHKNPSQATATHCKPEGVQNLEILTQGVIQKVVVINEANLNRLIMRSNVEHAIQFQDWVCEEVIPSIRKTGGYSVNPVTQLADILDDPAMNSQLMLELTHRVQKLKQENQIQAQDIEVKTGIIKVQAETIQELAPKAAAADRLMSAGGSKLIKVCAKDLKIPLKAFVRYLLETKWVHRTCEKGDLLAQSDKLAKGLMVHIPTVIESGGKLIHGTQARITGLGLVELAKLLNIDLVKLSGGNGMVVVKFAGLQVINHNETVD